MRKFGAGGLSDLSAVSRASTAGGRSQNRPDAPPRLKSITESSAMRVAALPRGTTALFGGLGILRCARLPPCPRPRRSLWTTSPRCLCVWTFAHSLAHFSPPGEGCRQAWGAHHEHLTLCVDDAATDQVHAHMEEAWRCGCHAKNTIVRRCGVAPRMAVFGRGARLQGSLMSSDASSSLLQVSSQNEALAMSVQSRAAVVKAMVECDATCAVQNSIYKQSRPMREFEVRYRVCF